MSRLELGSRRRARVGWIGSLVLGPVGLAFAPLAAVEAVAGSEPALTPELEAVRAATEKYKDPLVAVLNGYFSTVGCVQYKDGGMGVHFLNLALLGPVPDPLAPRILMYEPLDDGTLGLAAVEWFVPLATGVKQAPELFGETFEGPMAGHTPLLPAELHHYDFHAWIFKENPAGLFHHVNPTVECVGKWPYALEEEHPPMVPNPN
jgi:hypothetical protein